jgi:ABC-2 type transport system ATP-binding protein
MAVVPEEANVYLDLSVWQNIMLMAQLHGIGRKKRTEKATQLLERLGLTAKKKARARSLSKGLRQRLMLCAALVTAPRILFLDEPTSGLDVHSARLIRQIVQEMNQAGLTVFITTHNMEEAGEICSRIGIISQGRIAAIDTPDRLRSAIDFRQYVAVRFDRPLADPEQLKTLDSVLEMDGHAHTFRLYSRRPGQVACEVAGLARELRLGITHLATCQPSLEDVFLHFTQTRKTASS